MCVRGCLCWIRMIIREGWLRWRLLKFKVHTDSGVEKGKGGRGGFDMRNVTQRVDVRDSH